MKTFLLLILMAINAYSQGYVYDQSSATNPVAGGGAASIQIDQPMGQSFTPSLAAIGFVQLNFEDQAPPNGSGATVFVNLWSGSISNGTLLSSTAPAFIPFGVDHYVTNFTFSASVSLTPGTIYYLQPYIQSGDSGMNVVDSVSFNYAGGTLYGNGVPDPNNQDLWFREGIIAVPESSSSLLILIGSSLFIYVRHKHKTTAILNNPLLRQ